MSSFVLVPGAGGQAWYWHRVVPLLERAGHTAVAVELPAGDDTAGWTEYADTIVAAAPPRPVVVVAQSMGGFSAPVAATRLDTERIVLLNAMVPLPGERFGQWWEVTGSGEAMAEAAAAGGWSAEFDDETFFHDVPADVREAAFAQGEPDQAEAPLEQPWPLDAWPDIPTSGFAGADDRLFPPAFQQRVARERIGVDLGIVPGGHLAALSRPEEVAAALLAR